MTCWPNHGCSHYQTPWLLHATPSLLPQEIGEGSCGGMCPNACNSVRHFCIICTCVCYQTQHPNTLVYACHYRPKGCVVPTISWYSQTLQKACYVHAEVVPADLMQATYTASGILRTSRLVRTSVLSCIGNGSGSSAAAKTGYRCG